MKKNYMRSYERDASRLKGEVIDVFHPESLEEIKKIVLENKKIVIRGAGTGLAGGCVPQKEVVLDLSKMSKIGEFDFTRKTIVVEAGVVLDDLQEYLRESGLEFPVKPSSHAVCTIGGMIATDAVGNRGVLHGKTSSHVRWVEVMNAEGEVNRTGVTELSDYAGLEGITGVIVRACLNLSEIKKRSASLVRLKDIDSVIDLVKKLKMRRDVSAIEFFDKMVSRGIGLLPLEDFTNEEEERQESFYHVLIEYESLGVGGEESVVGKMVGEDYEKIMTIRDLVYPFVSGEGYTRIEDPKVMIDKIPQLFRWLEKNGIPTFGHIGTGILHPCFNTDQERLIPEMMKLVNRLGGQVSGEHGIGILKRGFVEINDQKIIRNVKKRLDPLGKFNSGKVI